jgi:hypothetical protein
MSACTRIGELNYVTSTMRVLGADVVNIVGDNCMRLFHRVKNIKLT